MFVDELKTANKQLQNEKKILEQEVLLMEKELNDHELSKKELYEDNKQLLIQMRSLEQRKEEVFNKYKELQ